MSKLSHAEASFFLPASTKALEEEHNTIFLINDHAELAEFMIAGLPSHKISQAVDGIEGLQKVFNLVPDLVIINASMPVIDGYECCKRIKENERTSHIPVILLIGKLISDTCISELVSDADDYLIEPFSSGELRLRVNKLLIRQHHLKKMLRKEIGSPVNMEKKIIFPESQIFEDPFLKKMYAIIEDKHDDVNFNVAKLADYLSISRAKLYRNLKTVSSLKPGSIINNYRLQLAAYYLRSGCNSSETAYKTGFNSPAYFTQCFRRFYNLTPHEFSLKKL